VRERIIDFIDELRTVGLTPSVAESIDALHAISLSGVDHRTLREALAATLVKDEAERPAFDLTFDKYFAVARTLNRRGTRAKPAESGAGRGTAEGPGATPGRRREQPEPTQNREPRAPVDPDHKSVSTQGQKVARRRSLARREFKEMDPAEIEACELLAAEISRRFRSSLARRYRRNPRGRLDLRRVLRHATRTGGVPIQLAHRRRRPGRNDLLLLCDYSHSVTAASRFLLSLVLPCREFFRRLHLFAFVDHPVPISVENHHLVRDGNLDLHARSDFGRTIHEVRTRFDSLITRSTTILVLGDARNNRRPPRADLLRKLAASAGPVIWLNPEAQRLWNTGDSQIEAYRPHCTLLLAAATPAQLESSLRRSLSG